MLLVLLPLQLWAAHALAFFAHEYAHSFTAWILGWKRDPFALNYAHPTPVVLLLQLGINQNVDEAPIFASGHGIAAAMIAAAGALLGNALFTYPLSRLAYAKAKQIGNRAWAMCAYWVTVASIGNFIDYVPVRTFTNEGDIGSVQRGLGWSPWTVLLVLGTPTLLVLIYFCARLQPKTLAWLYPVSRWKRVLIAALTSFAIFGFYGAAGLLEGGPISHTLSLLSLCVLFPLLAIVSGVVSYQGVTLKPVTPPSSRRVSGSGYHQQD